MAGKAGFGVTIGATDLASPVLDRINKKISAMTAPAERFNRTMAKFGDVSGISRLSEGMGSLGHNALDAFRSSDRLAGSMAAITGAGSIAGIVALTDKYAQLGTRLTNVAYRMNMPAAGLSKMEQAGKLAGVSIETTDAAMQGLQRSLMDATYHGDKAAQQTFGALKMDWHDAGGNALSAADTIGVLADAIKNLPDGTRQAHALATLGIPAEFLPAIKNGSKGLKDLEDQAVSLGGVMTDKMIKDADETGKSFNRLEDAIEGVRNRLADRLAPTLTKYIDQTADWISKNKDVADSYTLIGTKAALMGTGLLAIGKFFGWRTAARLGLAGAGAEFGVDAVTPSDTQSQEDDRAPYGGKSLHERFPELVVPHTTALGPNGADYLPRGIRNNNPLNLSYLPGQGASGSDGRFGIYPNMESGVAAADSQLQRYQDVYGLNTVRGILNRWAPAGENDTGAYVDNVSRRMRISPDQPLNVHNASTASSLIRAMARHETGREIDEDAVRRGVAMGDPASMASGIPGTEGRAAPPASAHLTVEFKNAPPGVQANIVTTGPITASAPRIGTTTVGTR